MRLKGDYSIGLVDIFDPWRTAASVAGVPFSLPVASQLAPARRGPTLDDFATYTGSDPDRMADLEARQARSRRFIAADRVAQLSKLRADLAVQLAVAPTAFDQRAWTRDIAKLDEQIRALQAV